MFHQDELYELSSAFSNAHKHVLKHIEEIDEVVKSQSSHKLMIIAWNTVHNSNPIVVNSRWKYIDFPNEKCYTLFLLKWSS